MGLAVVIYAAAYLAGADGTAVAGLLASVPEKPIEMVDDGLRLMPLIVRAKAEVESGVSLTDEQWEALAQACISKLFYPQARCDLLTGDVAGFPCRVMDLDAAIARRIGAWLPDTAMRLRRDLLWYECYEQDRYCQHAATLLQDCLPTDSLAAYMAGVERLERGSYGRVAAMVLLETFPRVPAPETLSAGEAARYLESLAVRAKPFQEDKVFREWRRTRLVVPMVRGVRVQLAIASSDECVEIGRRLAECCDGLEAEAGCVRLSRVGLWAEDFLTAVPPRKPDDSLAGLWTELCYLAAGNEYALRTGGDKQRAAVLLAAAAAQLATDEETAGLGERLRAVVSDANRIYRELAGGRQKTRER